MLRIIRDHNVFLSSKLHKVNPIMNPKRRMEVCYLSRNNCFHFMKFGEYINQKQNNMFF